MPQPPDGPLVVKTRMSPPPGPPTMVFNAWGRETRASQRARLEYETYMRGWTAGFAAACASEIPDGR